jgi:predicted solute-binding protein
LDAALVSITEVLLNPGYSVLDGVGIVSRGPVYSVVLAHRRPLEELQSIELDPASCTSVQLLKVLLAERGLTPTFRPLNDYRSALESEAVLLIGDAAIEFRRNSPRGKVAGTHTIWDLGEAWAESTGLPFVYAAWAVRKGVDWPDLSRRLWRARDEGLQSLETIIEREPRFDAALRRAYLGGHIQYEIGERERAGVARFAEGIAKSSHQTVFPVDWRSVG